MAQIRSYNDAKPVPIKLYDQRTVPNGTPTPTLNRVDASSGLDSLSKGLDQVGAVLAARHEDDAKVYASTALANYQAFASKTKDDLALSSPDGWRDLTTNFETQTKGWQQEAIKNAPSHLAKKYLQDSFDRTSPLMVADAYSYELGARRKWRADSLKANIDNVASQLVADPRGWAIQNNEQGALIDALSDVTPDERRGLKQYQENAFAAAAVSGMIKQDPYGTAKLLADPMATGPVEKLNAAQRVQFIAQVKQVGLADEARKQVSEITQQTGDDQAAFYKQADEIENTELRDEVVQRGQQQFALVEKAKGETLKNTLNRATAIIESTGSTDAISLPDKTYLMTHGAWDNVRDYALKKARGGMDEIGLFGDLHEMSANAPEKFAQPGFLEKQRPYVSEQNYQRLVARRDAILNHQTKGAEPATINSAMNLGRAKLQNLGFDLSAKSKDPKLGAFKDALAARIDDYVFKHDQQPGASDLSSMVNDLLTVVAGQNGPFGNTLFGKGFRGYEVYVPFSKIPAESVAKITADLRKNNVFPSRELVEQLYSRRVMQDKGYYAAELTPPQ